jgi:hypothetical protein
MLATFVAGKPTEFGRFFSGLTIGRISPRWIAIAITLILHIFILWALLRNAVLIPSDEFRLTNLRYITLPIVEDPDKPRLDNSLTLNFTPDSNKLLQIPLQQLPELVLEPEPLNQRELNEIVGHSDYLLQNNTQGISRNVFHPGLRKKLTAEENKPVLARVEDRGLETHTDPTGATVVKLGSGNCLRSPAVKSGEARNWYMTPCAGKTESETIMDRVDHAVNGKLELD